MKMINKSHNPHLLKLYDFIKGQIEAFGKFSYLVRCITDIRDDKSGRKLETSSPIVRQPIEEVTNKSIIDQIIDERKS